SREITEHGDGFVAMRPQQLGQPRRAFAQVPHALFGILSPPVALRRRVGAEQRGDGKASERRGAVHALEHQRLSRERAQRGRRITRSTDKRGVIAAKRLTRDENPVEIARRAVRARTPNRAAWRRSLTAVAANAIVV